MLKIFSIATYASGLNRVTSICTRKRSMLKLLGIGITPPKMPFQLPNPQLHSDDWMPWYKEKECYDFSLLGVNRSFETVASVTSIVILSKVI